MTSEQNDFTLYTATGCPYCHEVLDFIDAAGLSVNVVDTSIDHNAVDVIYDVSGQDGVPCIIYGDSAIFDFEEIITFLGDWFDIPQKAEAFMNGDDIIAGNCSATSCTINHE